MADTPQWKTKGLLNAALLVAWGWLGAIYLYFRDKGSMDYSAMSNALQGAILHAVLFTVAGLLVLAWYYKKDQRPFDED